MEGKHKNLLRSGQYKNKITNKISKEPYSERVRLIQFKENLQVSNLNEKQNILSQSDSMNPDILNKKPDVRRPHGDGRTLIEKNLTMYNKTLYNDKNKQSEIEGVSISNFTKLLKNSKKHSSGKKTNSIIQTPYSSYFSYSFRIGDSTRKSNFNIGNNFKNINKGGFFPYRKSFICYWLLPFVGFVSYANLLSGKQPTKEYNISNTVQNSKSDFNEKQKNRADVRSTSERRPHGHGRTIDYNYSNNLDKKYTNASPFEWGISPYVSKKTNFLGELDLTPMSRQISTKHISSKRLNDENKSFLHQKLNNTYNIFNKTQENHSNVNLSIGSKTNIGINPISNSLKYCILYLDCLENDLNLLEKTDSNTFIKLSPLLQSNNLQKELLSRPHGRTPYCFRVGYPNSFFNRVLFSNESYNNSLSLNEPLKLHFNVPLQNSNLNITHDSSNYYLKKHKLLTKDKVVKNSDDFYHKKVHPIINIENNTKKVSDIINEKIFLSKFMFKTDTEADVQSPSGRSHGHTYQISNKMTQKSFTETKLLRNANISYINIGNINTQLNKKNPVSSFLRACTLLDKYMAYRPLLQDLETPNAALTGLFQSRVSPIKKKNVLNQKIHINSELIDKLFSYYSKESTYLSFQKLFNQSNDTENLFLKSGHDNSYTQINTQSQTSIFSTLDKNQKENLLPKSDLSLVNNVSPKKVTIIFKKLGLLDSKKAKEQLFLENKDYNIKTNNNIFIKISKDNVYNIVLSTLKEKLNYNYNKSNNYSNLNETSQTETYKPFLNVELNSDSKKTNINSTNKTDVKPYSFRVRISSEIFSSLPIIKFKHPILMSNQSSYPLLYSKNKSIGDVRSPDGLRTVFQTTELDKYKNIYPLMLQSVSPVLKEKRPLENYIKTPYPKGKNFTNKSKNSNRMVQEQNTREDNKKTFENPYSERVGHPHGCKFSNVFSLNFIENSYFQFKSYLNKYIGYALKDFLILNKISTYINPFSKEYYINNIKNVKNTNELSTSFISGLKTPYSSDSFRIGRVGLLPVNMFLDGRNGIFSNKKILSKNPLLLQSRGFISIKSAYLLDNETKKNLLEKNYNFNRPNKNFFLTQESPLKTRKIRENDKTAKLLRAYLSIKKSSKKEFYGMQTNFVKNNTILSNSLKQKIAFNLISKSYVQNSSFSKQIENQNKENKEDYVYPLKVKTKLDFLSTKENLQDLQAKFSKENLQAKFSKLHKRNEIKEFSISPRFLLDNKLLLKINNRKNIIRDAKPILGSNVQISKTEQSLFPNEEIIRKRKSIQKKRRITKLKKETRRRKKRMRFYPRPIWLRYRFYSQFLKSRRYIKTVGSTSANTSHINYPINNNSRLFKKPYNYYKYPLFPYTTGSSFVNLSPSVMGEFKTAFWKSYWLRSNLKPYLKKIKTSLKDIKETTTREGAALTGLFQSKDLNNVNNFISSILGLNSNVNSNVTQISKDISTPLHSLSQKDMDSYYKTANYLAEYNEISSKRIEQFVSQIRENLTLNGHVKIRPSRINMNFGQKSSKKNDINFLKRPTLRYNTMSRLRLYWAFSKGSTNLASLGPTSLLPGAETVNGNNYNKRKQIWTTEKFRQQTKDNKTKKLLKDIKTKLQSLLNQTPYISLEKNIPLWNTLILKSLKKMRIQEEKLQNLAFVNMKTNSNVLPKRTLSGRPDGSPPLLISKRLPETKSIQFVIRHNRFKDSYKRTAKVQPFISGKTNYWWTYDHNTLFSGLSPFLSRPVNAALTGLFQSKDFMQISGPFRQDNSFIFNNQIKKGLPSLQSNSSIIGMESHLSSLQINTILFHFCSLITLLSISQIRGLLKFTFIGVNKIYSLLERLIPLYLYNIPFKGNLSTNFNNKFRNKHNFNKKMNFNLSQKGGLQTINGNSIEDLKFNNINNNKISNLQILTPLTKNVNRQTLSGPHSLLFQNRNFNMSENIFENKNKLSLFDFEKRNNSFFYGFYVNNNQKDIKPNQIDTREGALLFQSKDFLNLLMSPRGKTVENPSGQDSTREGNKKIVRNPDNLPLDSKSDYFNYRLETTREGNKDNKDYVKLYIKPSVNNTLLLQSPVRAAPSRVNQEISFLPFVSITGIYSLLNYLVKKPIFIYYKWTYSERVKSLYSTMPKSDSLKDDKNTREGNNIIRPSNNDINKELSKTDRKSNYTNQIKNFSILYSLLFIRFGFNNFNQLSKNASNLLGQRTKLEAAFRSIYTFFEKPGVLIVDWIAYLFLVEWASDITNTLPENVDTQIAGSPFNKLTRTIYTIYPFLPWTQVVMNQLTSKSLGNNDLTPFISELTYKTTLPYSERVGNLLYKFSFLSLASTFLKRRVYHLYEIIVLKFYQPDTDLLVRQKKGIVFWDIWGDFLTQTAEDSNVNISELTSLKEEQIKLLENASENLYGERFSTKTNKIIQNKSYNVNSLSSQSRRPLHNVGGYPKQKIYTIQNQKSGIFSITPLKYLLNQKQITGSYNNEGRQNFNNNEGRQDKLKITSSVEPSTDILGMSLQPFSGLEYSNIANIDSGLHQWGSQQFLSYAIKSKDTELFMDLHPPRALASVLKNKESSQQLRAISPMGSLVCQIFAGILYKQISKNILIVGNPYSERVGNIQNKKNGGSSQLNDGNASMEKTLLVQAIAGETELKIITDNAHRYALVYRGVAVGIKLLRDVFDSLSLQTPCFFLIEDIHAIGERRPFLISDDTPEGNTEIHEKNQVLYQLSKHVISHYKKPYKGDFSLSIPTNHFCFDFFKARNQNSFKIAKTDTASTSELRASLSRQNTVSPKILHNQTPDVEQQNEGPRILASRLLRPSTELLSPPATSPFSVLTLKEEKKLKTHKKVSDLPWTGKISSQGENTSSQDSQKTGPTYSIRAKVALLADIAISSLSVKLDMITDLLVIIDSVKGNRGFVVFATTHIPFVLDPALRRPGRLDETISFGFSSKTHSWEISNFGILNVSGSTYPQINSNLMSNFNVYSSLARKGGSSLDFSLTSTGVDTNTILSRLSQKAIEPFSFSFSMSSQSHLKRTSSLFHFFPDNLFNDSSRTNILINNISSLNSKNLNINYPKTTKILSQVAIKASAYLNASLKSFDKKQIESISKEQRNLDLHMNNALTQLPNLSLESNLSNSSHLSMYTSPHFFKNNISLLISGKIGEFFLFSKTSQLDKNYRNNFKKFHSTSSNFVNKVDSISVTRRSSLMPVVTESISSLVLSFVQKRFLYKNNLMLPTLLNLSNYSSPLEPSSPPITSILLPAKRYENLKRSLSYYQNQDQNLGSGIMEKINIHQQQRLVKRLYNIPVKESFKSEIIENRLSNFSNASLMIGSINPSGLQKVSNSNWFVKNRIFTRHSHYLTNQWWNGQLPEHNAETTFLSDIDWRYTFVEREARDILLDFPDADQHYNPRNRRWVGNTNSPFGIISMPSLTNSESSFYSEIYSHFIYDSFLKAFNIYEQNREIFDYYVFYISKQGLNCHLHEFERLKLIQRFLEN
jgi:hypothetical protein